MITESWKLSLKIIYKNTFSLLALSCFWLLLNGMFFLSRAKVFFFNKYYCDYPSNERQTLARPDFGELNNFPIPKQRASQLDCVANNQASLQVSNLKPSIIERQVFLPNYLGPNCRKLFTYLDQSHVITGRSDLYQPLQTTIISHIRSLSGGMFEQPCFSGNNDDDDDDDDNLLFWPICP